MNDYSAQIEKFLSIDTSWQAWFVDPKLKKEVKTYVLDDFQAYLLEFGDSVLSVSCFETFRSFLNSEFPRIRLWLLDDLWIKFKSIMLSDLKDYLDGSEGITKQAE